jgi:hypothetical protein
MLVSLNLADDAGEPQPAAAPAPPLARRAATARKRAPASSVASIRYTVSVADEVRDLLLTEVALDKLGGRGIGTNEAEQLLRNAHVIVRNPRSGDPGTRRLVIGRTDGGRCLTLVIEQTRDDTTWLIVTGWVSTEVERKILATRI